VLVSVTGISIRQKRLEIDGEEAYYCHEEDVIHMPYHERFYSTPNRSNDVAFASVLAHELFHWTGHESRLSRKFGKYGTPDYAFEELIAELGSAFVCSELDIAYTGIPENAGYIENWLQRLRDDPKAIFKASSQAMKAKQFLAQDKQEEDTLVA